MENTLTLPMFPGSFFSCVEGDKTSIHKNHCSLMIHFWFEKGGLKLKCLKENHGASGPRSIAKRQNHLTSGTAHVVIHESMRGKKQPKYHRHVINSNLFPCTADWFRPKPNHSHKKRYHPKTSNPPEKPNNPLKPLRQLVHQSSHCPFLNKKANTSPGWLHAHAPWCGWKWNRVHCRSSHGWRDQVATEQTTKPPNPWHSDHSGLNPDVWLVCFVLRPHFGILIFQ